MGTVIFSDQMVQPYSQWLTDCLQEFGGRKLSCVAIAAIDAENGDVVTGYYQCFANDKAILAANINADSMLDLVKANAADILEAAEREDDVDG